MGINQDSGNNGDRKVMRNWEYNMMHKLRDTGKRVHTHAPKHNVGGGLNKRPDLFISL